MSEFVLPDVAARLLAPPNPAVMGTLRQDGHPVTVATWYLLEDDGRILLNLDAGRARLRHLRADPRVSLTVLAEGGWMTHVSLQGHVESIVDDEGLRDIDRLARRYGIGEAYPVRDRPRVSAHMRIESCHLWNVPDTE